MDKGGYSFSVAFLLVPFLSSWLQHYTLVTLLPSFEPNVQTELEASLPSLRLYLPAVVIVKHSSLAKAHGLVQ
jgi:hypothetical protein